MTTQDLTPTLTFSVKRTIDAPRERVFRAFTEPALFEQWWGPTGCISRNARIDLRVGGAYSVDMELPDGNTTVLRGEYRVIDPPHTLSYTFAWDGDPVETVVTVEFDEANGSTELTLTHEGFPDQPRMNDHETGWVGSLDRLEAAVVDRS